MANSTGSSSYMGIRDLKDPATIKEEDIVLSDGSVIGVKNRVKAGMATFQNAKALERVSPYWCCWALIYIPRDGRWCFFFTLQRQVEDGKIIVYTTSFRGVRATFEDCRYITSLFHNHRVKVEERDIYTHQHYHRELEERLGEDKVLVPQVFINGQYVGVSHGLPWQRAIVQLYVGKRRGGRTK